MIDDNERCILMVVKQIPKGKVATYGQVARIAGIPNNSRQVGSVLKSLPEESGVPWYRVVNSRGEISQRGDENSQEFQRVALESEKIQFDDRGRVSLNEFGWEL